LERFFLAVALVVALALKCGEVPTEGGTSQYAPLYDGVTATDLQGKNDS